MSAEERSGWRDLRLSKLHRTWGFDVPATDVDLFVEYDHSVPRGVVEYKHEQADLQHSTHPNYKCLVRLADCDFDPIPLLAVRYSDDFTKWTVTALNETAKTYQPQPNTMTQDQYIALLYTIRGRSKP